MRPRLSRPFSLTLLALAGLIVLSYFPLARTRAAGGATIVPSTGKPLVNLANLQTLKVTYTGSADAVLALQGGSALAKALAAADFDADGAMDVVAGFSTAKGGVLALHRGNPDAYAPTDPSLYQKALQGNVPATFLSRVSLFTVPVSPDLLVTGDFNHDGYQDVLVAARDGALYLLAGDGHGKLLAPQMVTLRGQVQALAASGDGHVAVSLDGPNGPQLAILAPSAGGLILGATYTLPARGDSVAWGNLGGGADVAVGAGANLVMIYGPLGKNPQTEAVNLPFQVEGLTLGDFIWDRDGRTEISVLASDGTIDILQHGTLNTTPLTAADIPGRRAAIMAKSKQPANPTAVGPWTVAKQLPYSGSAPAGPVSASGFNSPRLAAASTHDLMVLDAETSQLRILDTSGAAASPSAAVSFSGTPVAALAMPQKINASRDVVVLTSAQSAPTIITADADPTYNVNTTTDEDLVGACTNSSLKTPPPTLSLREAVCIANNNGAGTYVINVPAGTYILTNLETVELQTGTGAAGENISLIGAGASNTLILQSATGYRIIEEDFSLGGNNPLSISGLTLEDGNCTNVTASDCGFGGGAILAGGIGGDDLTLTNAMFINNAVGISSDVANGGAVEFDGPTLTVTSSTFVSNNSDNVGGAIDFSFSVDTNGNLVVTNSTFASNSAVSGGGIEVDADTGTSATISGSTFTGNAATGATDGFGGAIHAGENADGYSITVSDSRIVGNSAATGGSGVYVEGSPTSGAGLINNWWGCNTGPGGSGCDTVAVASSVANTNPWLVLTISASPTSILPGGTSNLTAAITQNSNGVSGFSVPNGVAVAFGATLGSDNPTNSTLTSGQATSVYTADATDGAGSATATVDNATASVTINILDTVSFNTSPAGLSYMVDSVTYTTPQTFNWVVGSTHSVSTTSPQPANAGAQYAWASWSDGGAISHTVTAPAAATTYTANFNLQYQLTTAASPSADGSVTPTSGGYFNAGSSVPIAATANAGFQFTNWTSSPDTVVCTTCASTTITMNAPESVTANFVASTVQITIATSPANLLVSADGGPFTAAPLVESWAAGSTHTIATSSPQAGGAGVQYVWSSWSDSGAISHSITVPSSPTTYTATFNTHYQLTMVASPSADGSVTPASGSYYVGGAIIPVTATANAGFQFTNWTSTGGTFVSTTSPSTNFTMPSAPATVTGNFSSAAVQITITTSPANLLVSADGGIPVAAPLVESWIPGSSHTIATTSPQAGGAGVQYVWSSWSDSGAISHSITVPSTATTYTASFNTQYQLTTAASPSNGGTVSPASGNFYNSGTVVSLLATANAGYTFSSWTGNVANASSASTTITMTAPQSVTANFVVSITGPVVSLSPTSVSFGPVVQGSLHTKNVEVSNIGTAPLLITDISLTNVIGDAFTFETDCGSRLAPGKSCVVKILLSTAELGSDSGTLNIADNAPGSPQEVPLSARVVEHH